MRLGLDLLFLIPRETGGRETYARQLITAMLDADTELRATAFVNREAEPDVRGSFGSSLDVVAVPVSARSPGQWAVGELALLPRAAARARVDVLHSLANFGPASGRFARVLTIHDLQYRAVPELLTRSRRAGTAALIGLAARRAQRIISVSAFTAGELVGQLSLPPERIEVIPNGVAAPASDAVSEAELRERHQLGDRPVALTVSTALSHKNLVALLDAQALIPAERRPVLMLVGAGTDGPELRARASAAGVQADTRLLGFQPAEALEGLYRLATCAVMPSLYEGFGLPVLEAMIRGVPVACSDIPALREVAGESAVWFAPRAPEIATAIVRLLDDHALARELAESGRRRAERFTWTRAAEATLGCYRRALGREGAVVAGARTVRKSGR
jgi:glycosyltransferase involved in cell wall biosynthesis